MVNPVESYICFDSVQKTYDGHSLVIKNLNLDIQQGEFLTLLGPSGSGKTTCLMLLAGFENPTSGNIYLKGQPLHAVPPHKRDIGIVFQNYALFPHMTVAENLAYPLRIRRLSKSVIADEVKAILDLVKLSALADRYPMQLSGGQQQRVALARALVFKPALVLMDEPLGALDKQLREQMQMELRYVHQQLGLTVVFVTHDQSEALIMSDRIAVFHDGIIQQVDTPKALYEQPSNSFVAQFIGENNKLLARVTQRDSHYCQVLLDNGQFISATTYTGLSTGEVVFLSIRPERILLNDSAENKLTVIVDEWIYLGDHFRVKLSLDMLDEVSFVAKIPVAAMPSDLKKGQRIAVSWHAKDMCALPL